MNRATKLRLYRNILQSAKNFPSIKRNSIIMEIKETFRQYRDLTDEKEIEKCIAVAVKGLSQLSMYSSLKRTDANWVVNLDSEPMPKKS